MYALVPFTFTDVLRDRCRNLPLNPTHSMLILFFCHGRRPSRVLRSRLNIKFRGRGRFYVKSLAVSWLKISTYRWCKVLSITRWQHFHLFAISSLNQYMLQNCKVTGLRMSGLRAIDFLRCLCGCMWAKLQSHWAAHEWATRDRSLELLVRQLYRRHTVDIQ